MLELHEVLGREVLELHEVPELGREVLEVEPQLGVRGLPLGFSRLPHEQRR